MAASSVKTPDVDPGRPLRHTQLKTQLFGGSQAADKYVSMLIRDLIQANNMVSRQTVLGLATGSTPIGVYRELIRMHRDEGLDFSRVVSFNLDEYWPMDPQSIHSYNRWMREMFFNHINMQPENIHIPRGDLQRSEIESFCQRYEQQIQAAGGIDLQILGIGRSGHIGFNEPGSPRTSRTRLVTLDAITRRDAAGSFSGIDNVPTRAITMGMETILTADRIVLMAFGEHKAEVVRHAAEGEVTTRLPASLLQSHPNVDFVVDRPAAAGLTEVRTPWQLFDPVDWTPEMEKRAVIWLAERCQKPLLTLDASDFKNHQLDELLQERGPTEAIRDRVFQSLLSGICARPGGDIRQTIIIFSPHPDDDVISMGGTLHMLAQQGHDVQIAYMSNGSAAVFDHDALRHIDYVAKFHEAFELADPTLPSFLESMRETVALHLEGRPIDDKKLKQLLSIKSLIRMTEATAAALDVGVPENKLHFLDMPFYRERSVANRAIGDDDVAILVDLLTRTEPGQIYVAGDLADPHGTHRLCAQAIFTALTKVASNGIDPEVWLYRGAWQEFEPHEIDRAVPLGPETVESKRLAIFKHESQKDAAMFPGDDEREFWKRAEERTTQTAQIYNALGLPEYLAIEAFQQFTGEI